MGFSECSGRPIFIKENRICAMTRHHSESNIIFRNLLDSDVRQCSHSLIISLHYLQAKSNNRTCDQFEYDVNWFCFCFDFVRSLAWCGCCSIVYWRVCGCVGAGGREGGLVRLKLDVQGQGGGEILDVDGQGGS